MLHVESLKKQYGKQTILDNLSFTIDPGQIVGLVGENGAGKSTLLQLLATVIRPTSGTIHYNELAYQQDQKQVRKHIGFVPQDIAVWEDFTVKENMLFFEKLAWKRKDQQALQQLCQDMGLDKWKESVKTLSGGMKRKLNLAISLIHDPTLILLDEPTVGIDLKSRKEIGHYLHILAKQENKTIIYTSHDMDEIIQLCDIVYNIGHDPFYPEILQEAGKHVEQMPCH